MKYNRKLASLLALPVLTFATTLPLYAEAVPAQSVNSDSAQVNVASGAEQADVNPGATQIGDNSEAVLKAKQARDAAPDRVKGEPRKINFRTALARTAEYSPNLQAARSDIELAKWDTAKVLTGHNPKIHFDVNYQLTTPESVLRLDKFAMTITPTHAYNGALVLEQSLCTFGRLHYSELAARLNEELKRETYRYDYENALHNTAVAYVDCLQAKEQMEIAQSQVELREKSLRDAEALYNAGSTAKFDVLQVKTAVSGSKQSLLVAQNRYRLAMAKLCQMISYPVDTELDLQDVVVEKAVPTDLTAGVDFDESLKSAMACRPELHMLDWAKKATEANYELAGNSANPNLSFQTALSGSGANSNLAQSWGWSYTAGLVFSVPIYDGGERRVSQGKLLETIRQLDKQMESAVNNVTLDVKSCHYNLMTSAARINEARTSLEQAQEADRVAVVRYNAGLSTSTELLDAHTSLGLAEESLSTAKYGYFEAVIDWVLAISGRFPIDDNGMFDPEYLAAKTTDWYDLRKHANEQYDKVIKERLDDPTNPAINAKYHDYWLKMREQMHESGYNRAGITPEEDAVLKSGLQKL